MRRKDREITEIDDILKIVDTAKILHLGLFDEEFPYIVPMHYGYELVDNTLIFYMHGAKEGHKIDLMQINSNVCIELECDVDIVSGGDIPCRYGAAYSSVIGRGTAEIVVDEKEKMRGIRLLMLNQTGREFDIDNLMVSSVEVIKLTITDFTAKSRKKPH